ncbi:hypothetical protein A4X03_0g1380, partial [Tilletia caries]
MPPRARGSTSRAPTNASSSSTGARRADNEPDAPQSPPHAAATSAPSNDDPLNSSTASSIIQDALAIISSTASDPDTGKRYRQPKDAELHNVKRALERLQEHLSSSAAPAPGPSSTPNAADASPPISRSDFEILLGRFGALERTVLETAAPSPPTTDSTPNRRNPPPGTIAARFAATVYAHRHTSTPRVRFRVVLNTRGLPPDHPARNLGAPQIFNALKDPIFRSEMVTPLSVEKLRSGDIGINFANQLEVEQVLASEGDRWLAEAFPDQEALPTLREPTFGLLQTIVVHGIPFADKDGEGMAAALTSTNNINFINTRFLASPAKREAHPNGFGPASSRNIGPIFDSSNAGTVNSSATSRVTVADLLSVGCARENIRQSTILPAQHAAAPPPHHAPHTASAAPTAARRTRQTTSNA